MRSKGEHRHGQGNGERAQQWTAREALCHLLFEPGWKRAALLERFAVTDVPVVDITPGVANRLAKIRQAAGLPETK